MNHFTNDPDPLGHTENDHSDEPACPDCGGSGVTYDFDACPSCNGTGGVTPPVATFTDDELVRFYEEWEFNEEDPGESEFILLAREVERRVLARTADVKGDQRG